MDFEILTSDESEKNFFTEIADFFRNRRRQLQDWESKPPHLFGWVVLGIVSLELILSLRISQARGFSREIINHAASLAFLVILVELALAKVAQEVGEFFKKKGNYLTTVTFFNIGLMPLLVVFPLSVLTWAAPAFGLFAILINILLLTKVLSNFRESLEISFEFSRLQSAIVLYLSGGFITAGLLIAFYISFFGFISEVASSL